MISENESLYHENTEGYNLQIKNIFLSIHELFLNILPERGQRICESIYESSVVIKQKRLGMFKSCHKDFPVEPLFDCFDRVLEFRKVVSVGF